MTIDYKLEPADYFAFAQERRQFFPRRWSNVYYYGIMPVLCAGLAVATESVALAVIFTLIFFSAGWSMGILNQKAYRTFYAEHLPAAIFRWNTTINAAGLQMASDVVDVCYHWPSIKRIFRNSRYVYFEIAPLMLVHVPIRAFQDQKQLQEFLDLSESYLKKLN